MIAAFIGLGAFFVLQSILGLTLILNVRVSDRVYIALIMGYMLSAGFTLGALMA